VLADVFIFEVPLLYSNGSSTLSSAVVRDRRLNPGTRSRSSVADVASSSFESFDTSLPSRKYWPDVGRSRHPTMCMNVDFEPEGP
jgi:hypothetical protein